MKDKYIERAFESLGLLYDGSIVSVSDIDAEINKNRALIVKTQDLIEEWTENIKYMQRNVELLEEIKHQLKVEKYKELNPNVEVY
jgi:hypothetical protein